MRVLYITAHDFTNVSSGSGVRPYAMYLAFVERGYEVKLLNANTGRGRRRERETAEREIEQWLKTNRPDFCYIESSTGPILHNCDYRLIRLLHRMRIPTAYFYRDYYRKFPDLFPRRKGIVNKLKETYLDWLQFRTDRILRKVNIVYIPSLEAKYLFPYADVRELPPAGNDCLPVSKDLNRTAIYVGGISEQYGSDVLLDAFSILNEGNDVYRLICICRANEFSRFSHCNKNASWLDVYHAAGEELEQYYEKASVAILPKKGENAYNKLAVSVKLFEYMGHGLPIVATSNLASDKIITKYHLGYIADNGAKNLADCIRKMFSDKEKYEQFCCNGREALLSENLWVHRVDQIQHDLQEYNS